MRFNNRPRNFYPTLSVASFSPLPPLLPELCVSCTAQLETVRIRQVQLSRENTVPTRQCRHSTFDLLTANTFYFPINTKLGYFGHIHPSQLLTKSNQCNKSRHSTL